MDEKKFHFKKDAIFLPALIFIHIACWFGMKPVFPQSDPLVYFTFAKRILNHEYVFSSSVQGHRFGVFIPQAIFIRLFGESPYIINLWTLLCSVMTIVLVYFFLKKNIHTNIAFAAGLLLAVNLVQIIYSVVIFPDMIVSFFALCCVYFIYKGRQEEKHYLKNSLLFILSFALGFTAKESIILILPFVVFIFWRDWKKKNPFAFQKNTGLLLAVFTLFLFAISKILTGDFMFFYKSYSHYTVFVPFSNFTDFLKRISYEPFLWINSQLGYIFLFVFSIPAFIDGTWKRDQYSSFESFISLYFLIMLLALWWGNVSLIHFGYLPIVDRRWMMLVAPLAILSAITIYKAVNEGASNIFYFLVITLSLLAVLNVFEFSFQRGMIFFSFVIVLCAEKILREKVKIGILFRLILLTFPFIILAFYFILKNSNYAVPPM